MLGGREYLAGCTVARALLDRHFDFARKNRRPKGGIADSLAEAPTANSHEASGLDLGTRFRA